MSARLTTSRRTCSATCRTPRDGKLLTTFAVFGAKQEGLATYAGLSPMGTYYYVPKDVKSRGFETEATGRMGWDGRLTAGYAQLKLTGPDGNDIYEWVPRRTLNFRADSRVPQLPKLRPLQHEGRAMGR